MMNVNSEITVSLTDKDKEILIKAIELCEAIATDCNCNTDLWIDADTVFTCLRSNYKEGKCNTDLWIDADTVFTCLRSNYKEGKLPTVNNIYE